MINKIKKIKELRRSRNNYIYSQYIAESIDKSISYTDYLSQNLYIDNQTNISYSEYLAEKIKP
jgi:ribonucleotide reductase beta subunit family protein with ferritin-like domain